MKNVLLFLLACVLLNVASIAVAILLMALVLFIIWSAIFRSRQFACFALIILLANLIEAYPGWTLLLIGVLATIGVAAPHRRSPPVCENQVKLLPPASP